MRILVSMAFGEGRERDRSLCWAIIRQTPNKQIGYHGEEVIAVCWDKEEADKVLKALRAAGDTCHYTEARLEDS